MKKFLKICLILVAFVSCKTNAPQPTVNTDAGIETSSVGDSPQAQLFSDINWELTIPFGWDAITSVSPPPEVKVAVSNLLYNNIIVFEQEKFSGSYEEYVVFALRGVTDTGARLISTTTVTLNGDTVFLLNSEKNGVTAWMWVTTKNGYGYALSCAGKTIDNWNHGICFNVFNSLKLK